MGYLSVFFDGASRGNPGLAGAGYVIYYYPTNDERYIVSEFSKFLGTATNNIAEYSAVVYALTELATIVDQQKNNWDLTKIDIYGDSLLVINQLNGTWKVRNKNIKQKWNDAKTLIESPPLSTMEINFMHVLRNLNKEADKLANDAFV